MFDDLLKDHPSQESFAAFDQHCQNFATEAIATFFPEGNDRRVATSSSSSSPSTLKTVPPARSCIGGTVLGRVAPLIRPSLVPPVLVIGTRCLIRNSPRRRFGQPKKAENTAPGPDRLTYHHLRLVDPGAKLLTRIFNLCLRSERFPSFGSPLPPFSFPRVVTLPRFQTGDLLLFPTLTKPLHEVLGQQTQCLV
ncbi:hypothetical protein CEXT_103051 [Caerostris extrusa]|uniref:Uncharacterized protein n=1 Tax=Caerostris extrusa TaxID=172846 RepID=A0AAV4X735_CAEEX|nr:hypothetical protein CEXT_103051 [Caerostris extrusa]